MNFLKALFGGKEENSEEKRQADEQKNFDILKYDGVKALKTGQWQQAIRCLNHALNIREDSSATTICRRHFCRTMN